MKMSERGWLLFIKALAVVSVLFPLAWQSCRILGIDGFLPRALLGLMTAFGMMLILSLPLLLAAPLFIVWGVAYVFFVRMRIGHEEPETQDRPSLFTFVLCAILWFPTCYLFKLYPFFIGETPVQRAYLDRWLDKLL